MAGYKKYLFDSTRQKNRLPGLESRSQREGKYDSVSPNTVTFCSFAKILVLEENKSMDMVGNKKQLRVLFTQSEIMSRSIEDAGKK